MAKIKTVFVCQECGARRPKWEGRCNDCGSWNSLVEETVQPTSAANSRRGWALGSAGSAVGQTGGKSLTPVTLDRDLPEDRVRRASTAHNELDRVLGGGLVSGSYVLVGGDPGIGKSTLLMQMAGGLARQGLKVLYVSAEESVHQTSMRAHRLGIREGKVQVASESSLETIIQMAQTNQPDVLIVDSIQTVFLSEITSAPGSVSQVRECAAQLMGLAKSGQMSVFIIGHVTKEGNLAGPRVLEHMVDTVLSFEGDANHQFRLLRALKNRFGATNELGVFQMSGDGLREVENPSEFFLEERGSRLIGSAIFSAMEGSRPLLCEIQALASSSHLAMPRRTSLGFDVNRVHLLIAVLDKHLDVSATKSDVFINIVGGLRLSEPSADLAVAAALLSTCGNQELPASACFFGEIGLTGEVRAANFAEERVKEALKLGFTAFVLPASNQKHLKELVKESKAEFLWVRDVRDLERSLGKFRGTSRPTPAKAKSKAGPEASM